jgi:hypothetical protein
LSDLRSTPVWRRAALAAVLAAAALAGCGGDDDEGPSKAEYVEKADAVCAKTDVKIDDVVRSVGRDPNSAQAQSGLRAILPLERSLLTELRALEKPAADEDEIDRIWDARERAVDELEAASRAPGTSLTYVETDETPAFEETARLASEYGMVDCEATVPGSIAAP